MPEKIYTFSEEELTEMFKSGAMKVVSTPSSETQKVFKVKGLNHKIGLEKAKILLGDDFEDVQTLSVGGKTRTQIIEEFAFRGIKLSPEVDFILNSSKFVTFPKAQEIELVKVRIKQLGFYCPAVTTRQLLFKANELGLKLCPAETGPLLVLGRSETYKLQHYLIAMEKINDWDGIANMFTVYGDSEGLSLLSERATDKRWWMNTMQVIFCL